MINEVIHADRQYDTAYDWWPILQQWWVSLTNINQAIILTQWVSWTSVFNMILKSQLYEHNYLSTLIISGNNKLFSVMQLLKAGRATHARARYNVIQHFWQYFCNHPSVQPLESLPYIHLHANCTVVETSELGGAQAFSVSEKEQMFFQPLCSIL